MARSDELNQKMKEERRGKILSAALYLFAVKGLAATKISDISKRSEMSQGLVYHYYKNKGEIFTELISTAFNQMEEAVFELEKLVLPADVKIKMAVEGIIASLQSNDITSLNYLLIANATISDAIPDESKIILNSKSDIPYKVMERIFLTGQSEGTVKEHNAKELSTLFWTSMKGLAIHKAAHTSFDFPDSSIILEMFIKR